MREMRNAEGLQCWFLDPLLLAVPGNPDGLMVGTIVPAWSQGWRGISRNEMVADSISWFFHYVAQYIARSQAGRVIAGAAVEYKRGVDFFGSWAQTKVLPTDEVHDEFISALLRDRAWKIRSRRGGRSRRFRAWVAEVNALDPFIHRSVYKYSRARHLAAESFDEECVTALDSVVSVAAQFAQHRLGLASRNRDEVHACFELSRSDSRNLHRLNRLRSHFGAHPGWSKWWDFSEMYGHEIDDYFDSVSHLMTKLIAAESSDRRVERRPENWADWFLGNADWLFDAVWVADLPE